MELELASIRVDGGTQSRLELNQEVVNEYAEHMAEGDVFPSVIVFQDGATYWLADGFHRYFATKKNKGKTIKVRCSGWDSGRGDPVFVHGEQQSWFENDLGGQT